MGGHFIPYLLTSSDPAGPWKKRTIEGFYYFTCHMLKSGNAWKTEDCFIADSLTVILFLMEVRTK